jgi:SAM-dependent methyltransferase
VFSTSRKAAQQKARSLIAGHVALTVWWALRHAGVFDAMLKLEADAGEGLNPLVHATRTAMAPDVLKSMFDYLAGENLDAFKGDEVRLTAEGRALLDHEDGVLELLWAYQPILDMSEHLLARLKTVGPGGGGYRKTEYLLDAQAKRFAADVFPAVVDLVGKHALTHLLDLTCGNGDLLTHVSQRLKNVVGVGIGADAFAVRKANAAIAAADLEKRLIAVPASPWDVCTDTQRTFDRIGISRQLWNELDLLIATAFFSELASEADAARALAGARKHFPKAALLVIEPVASPRFGRNYYAAELGLLLRLTRATPWPADRWRDLFAAAGYKVAAESPLVTDGITLFLCR